jgi:serine/threonine-protein kinase
VPAPAPGNTRPAWVLPAALVVVAGLAAGIYFATRSKPGPTPPAATPSASAPTLAPALTLPSGDMVLIPGGPFLGGAGKASIPLGPFYIDKTEVTNRAYAAFCASSGRPLPEGFPADKLDYPVVNITISEARDFAKAAGKRLPKGLEWEKAARGTDGRMFPWGDEADAARANVGGTALLPVTAFAEGKSPYGVVQMVGNAWEYIDEELPASTVRGALELFHTVLSVAPNQKWHQTRGLSFQEKLDGSVLFDYNRTPELWKSDSIGFRCVKDAQ